MGVFDASFWALRGGSSRIDAAARALHADYQVWREGGEVRVEHTVDVFLVDPRGRVRDVLPPYLAAGRVAEDVRAELRDSS